jgi:Protein of unknown function (DUF4199)
MEKSIKSSAINYGVYLGAALSLITITIWFVNLNLMANIWLGIGILLAAIAFGVVSTAKSKSIMNGFLTFKEAFSSYFITIAVGVIISQVVSFILFNFIDPEAAKQIQQITIDSTVNMMEGFGAPAETIAEAVEKIENTNQFSIVSVLKSTAWSLVFQAVIGLIVAAIMKKSNPDA